VDLDLGKKIRDYKKQLEEYDMTFVAPVRVNRVYDEDEEDC
jgi:hypothetical protein